MEQDELEIKWVSEPFEKPHQDRKYWFYQCKQKIDKQTLEMRFYQWDWNNDTIWFSIMLSVHNKRKHLDKNMEHKAITGTNPLKTISTALRMFKEMEAKCLEEFDYKNIIIFCTWLDKRRRDVYYRFLSKYGYRYGIIDGEKVIMKKVSR